jgi:hypothetical protein
MKAGPIIATTLIVCLVGFYQWTKMNQYPKKDKIVFLSITVIGWILAILLIYFPDLPGPNKMTKIIFEPFTKMMSK